MIIYTLQSPLYNNDDVYFLKVLVYCLNLNRWAKKLSFLFWHCRQSKYTMVCRILTWKCFSTKTSSLPPNYNLSNLIHFFFPSFFFPSYQVTLFSRCVIPSYKSNCLELPSQFHFSFKRFSPKSQILEDKLGSVRVP